MIGKLARSSLQTTAVLALRLATQAATLVLLTRLLQPALYGHYAAAASLAVVLGMLSSLGSGYVLLSRASGNLARAADTWRYAWPLTLAMGVVLILIYLPIALWLTDAQLSLSTLLWLGCTELLATPFTLLASFVLQSSERVPLSQLVQWLPLGLRVAAVLPCFALPLEARLPCYVVLQWSAGVIGVLVAWRIVRRHVPLTWQPRKPSGEELRLGASYAAMLLVAANPSELDKMAAVRLVGGPSAGIYTAGSRIMGALVMPVLAMLLAAQPRLFRHARDQAVTMRKLVLVLFGVALAWGIVSGAALAIASPWLTWIFGNDYARTAHLMPWMAITAPFLSVRLAAGSVLVATGHPLERVGFELGGIACLLGGMLAFAPGYGVIGLVAAVIVAELAMGIVGVLMVLRQLNRLKAVNGPESARATL
ncbi:lipopolysaccharide biosynthesis protein [Dyella sp.]|uniref:lipopolysaccharide biosynthesis protein n=1 Tax=Dyella sp. TaxID=1869338 RepID=UPI002ECFE9D5